MWEHAIALLIGMFTGSYLGVKYAVVLGDLKLKYVLLVSMIGFGSYFLFF